MGKTRCNMGIIKLDVSNIKAADWDLKLKNPDIFTKLRASVIKNDQIELIHVRQLESGLYEVFKGKKIFKILTEVGKETLYCYNHGEISELESKLRYLEMNIRQTNDFINIGEVLSDILEENKIEEIERFIQYDLKEIQDLVNLYNYDWKKLSKKKDKHEGQIGLQF